MSQVLPLHYRRGESSALGRRQRILSLSYRVLRSPYVVLFSVASITAWCFFVNSRDDEVTYLNQDVIPPQSNSRVTATEISYSIIQDSKEDNSNDTMPGLVEESPSEDESDDDDSSDKIDQAASRKKQLNPKLWQKFNYWDIHAYFSCEAEYSKGRPLYDDRQWWYLWDYYNEFAAKYSREFPTKEGEQNRTFKFNNVVFDFPLEPFQSKTKGRSVRASRDITSGEIVSMNNNNTAIFTSGPSYRAFLFGINEKHQELGQGIACDVLIWSWVQQLNGDSGPFVIFAPLDVSALMNDSPTANLNCGITYDYAVRNISKGEEITCRYSDFASPASWSDFGL